MTSVSHSSDKTAEMGDIEAVCFDLDETLVSYQRSPAEVLEISFERCGLDPFFTANEYRGVFDDHVEPGDRIADVRARCFERLARERGRDPATGRAVAEAYTDERDHRNVDRYAGVEAVLDALADEVALGLITNGPEASQEQKLEAAGLLDRFDATVYAGDEVAAKPDSEPFLAALSRLDATAEQAVHVGNSLKSDVRGARNVGMDAVWVTHGKERTVDDTVHRIEAVGELLTVPLFTSISRDAASSQS